MCIRDSVAGQLAVRAGEAGRQPDQGVPPIEGETQRPEQSPELVELPVMAVLMRKHVPEPRRVLRTDVDLSLIHI